MCVCIMLCVVWSILSKRFSFSGELNSAIFFLVLILTSLTDREGFWGIERDKGTKRE